MDLKEKIIKEAKRIEEDGLFSAKGHFYASQFWEKFHFWIGVPSAILAAVAAASALFQFVNHNIIAGILSMVVSALTAVATFINPNEKSSNHHRAGNRYNSLRNKARIFYKIEMQTISDEKVLLDKLNKINETRDKLNKESPQISKRDYEKAKRGIEKGEASYNIDNLT